MILHKKFNIQAFDFDPECPKTNLKKISTFMVQYILNDF